MKGGERNVIFNTMLQRSLIPNSVTYNTMFDGLSKEGQIDISLSIFDSMKKKNCKLDEFTYTVLINGVCK